MAFQAAGLFLRQGFANYGAYAKGKQIVEDISAKKHCHSHTRSLLITRISFQAKILFARIKEIPQEPL